MTGNTPIALWALVKKYLAPLALCVGFAGALPTSAFAAKPQFREIEIGGGFDVTTIVVEQQDNKWTRISNHPRTIPIHVKIKMSRGYIQFYRVGRGLTNGAVRGISLTHRLRPGGNSATDNRIEASIDSRTSVDGPVSIPIDEYTRLNASDEQAIVNRCNSKWTETERGHSFSYSLPLAMHADAREHRRKRFPYYLNEYEGYGDFARATATGFVGLKVECLGTDTKPSRPDSKPPSEPDSAPRASSSDPAKNSGPIEVTMNLDVAGGNACPRNATVKTRIIYDHPKTARFDIVRNGKVLKTVEIKARREALSDGSRQWVVDRIDNVDAKAGQNQFRIVVKGGGKSGMKTANVQCAPFQVLFSGLTYNVVDGGTCPKKVWETTTFSATGPGQATMQLVQENGSVFYEKTLKTILKNGKYTLVNQRVLSIERDTNKKFRAQIKGQSGIHSKWARLKVSCPKRTNPKAENKKEGPKGLVSKPKTTHSSTTGPVRSDARPRLVCTGGKVVKGRCQCGNSKIRKRVGQKQFQCVAVAKPTEKAKAARANAVRKNKPVPARTNPVSTKQRLICAGGTVRGGRCHCGQKEVTKKQGNRRFVCVARRG